MKKLKLIIVPILILFMSSGPMLSMAETSKDIIFTIRVEIEFGRKSRDCRGIGFCKFIIRFDLEPVVLARYIPKKDVLELEFPAYMIEGNKEQFENDVFILEEEFVLEDDVLRELGTDDAIIIPEGKYKGEWREDSFVVSFPLH